MKLCVHQLLFICTSLGLPEISKTQRGKVGNPTAAKPGADPGRGLRDLGPPFSL